MCFIESDAQRVNVGIYSEERVGVNSLTGDEVNGVKLMNGKGYGEEKQQSDLKS